MLSAIILVADTSMQNAAVAGVRDVAKSLAALVPLVVSNLVADALVVCAPDLDLDQIERRAGCVVISGSPLSAALLQAIGEARRETILLITSGFAPGTTFGDEIVEALAIAPEGALSFREPPESFASRLFPQLGKPAAVIARRDTLLHAARVVKPFVAAIARATRAKPLRSLAIRV